MATQYTAGLSVGQVLTAATMNSIGAAWETWTPALTASTTSPTLGTGSTVAGKYTRINKLVVANFSITFGTSGVAAGTGTYRISVPINSVGTQVFQQNELGSVLIRDASTQNTMMCHAYFDNVAYFILAYPGTYGGILANVTNAAPWTWAASDTLSGQIIYEAA